MAQNNNFFFKAMAIFSFIIAIANMFLIFRLAERVSELEINQMRIEAENESEVLITEEIGTIEEQQIVEEPATQKPKKSFITKKIKPSLKIRIEDRYAEMEYLPEGQFTEEGEVVVKVYVDWMGKVTKTSIVKSTISNEDVQYACREAALKTKFSYNTHADSNSRLAGTITYTFSAE